jgi:hypothetical protein
MNPTTVRRNLLQGPQQPGTFDRHITLGADFEVDLVTHLLEAFRAGRAMTRKELMQMMRKQHDTGLTPDWVNAFIGRHLDAL